MTPEYFAARGQLQNYISYYLVVGRCDLRSCVNLFQLLVISYYLLFILFFKL